ncbi:MAG: hypothetical protein QG593_718 [Patescibacteria group bacterium]|nr:hypothetical protein [Patescibacteria group bacterium]
MLKKILRSISSLLVISTALTLIAATTLVIVLTPGHLKRWIEDSDAYETIPSTIIEQSTSEQADSSSDISLSDPIILAAAKSTITSDFVQKSSEQIIDGVFVWLEGEAPNPTFSIDVAPLKKSFADKVEVAVKDRYYALPTCLPRTLPTSSDPLTINCRPAYGVDIEKASEDLRTEIITSNELLPENAITSANLTGSDAQNSVFNSKTGPQIYQSLQFAPFILIGLLALYSIGIIALSESKRKGLKRVGILFIVAGVLAIISSWISSLGYARYQDKILVSDGGVTNDIVLPVINAFRNDATRYSMIISGVVSGVGALIVALTVITKNRTKQNLLVDMHASKAADKSTIPLELWLIYIQLNLLQTQNQLKTKVL